VKLRFSLTPILNVQRYTADELTRPVTGPMLWLHYQAMTSTEISFRQVQSIIHMSCEKFAAFYQESFNEGQFIPSYFARYDLHIRRITCVVSIANV